MGILDKIREYREKAKFGKEIARIVKGGQPSKILNAWDKGDEIADLALQIAEKFQKVKKK